MTSYSIEFDELGPIVLLPAKCGHPYKVRVSDDEPETVEAVVLNYGEPPLCEECLMATMGRQADDLDYVLNPDTEARGLSRITDAIVHSEFILISGTEETSAEEDEGDDDGLEDPPPEEGTAP